MLAGRRHPDLGGAPGPARATPDRGLRLGPGYSILTAPSECSVRPAPCGHAGMYGRHRPWWPRPGSPAGVGAGHAPAATTWRRPVELQLQTPMLSERQPTDRTTPHDPRRRVKYVRRLDQVQQLSPEQRDQLGPVAFRANDYYLGLIDWDDPEDPIRQLIIPREEELSELLARPARGRRLPARTRLSPSGSGFRGPGPKALSVPTLRQL